MTSHSKAFNLWAIVLVPRFAAVAIAANQSDLLLCLNECSLIRSLKPASVAQIDARPVVWCGAVCALRNACIGVRFACMKKYKSIRISEDTYRTLLAFKASTMQQHGYEPSFDELLKHALEVIDSDNYQPSTN